MIKVTLEFDDKKFKEVNPDEDPFMGLSRILQAVAFEIPCGWRAGAYPLTPVSKEKVTRWKVEVDA